MEYHQPNQKYINVEYADFGTKNNLLWLTIPMMYKYDYKCVNRDKKKILFCCVYFNYKNINNYVLVVYWLNQFVINI